MWSHHFLSKNQPLTIVQRCRPIHLISNCACCVGREPNGVRDVALQQLQRRRVSAQWSEGKFIFMAGQPTPPHFWGGYVRGGGWPAITFARWLQLFGWADQCWWLFVGDWFDCSWKIRIYTARKELFVEWPSNCERLPTVNYQRLEYV